MEKNGPLAVPPSLGTYKHENNAILTKFWPQIDARHHLDGPGVNYVAYYLDIRFRHISLLFVEMTP